MTEIILSSRKLLGRHGRHLADEIISVDSEVFTPVFIQAIKNDVADSLGWKKHAKLLKEHGIHIE